MERRLLGGELGDAVERDRLGRGAGGRDAALLRADAAVDGPRTHHHHTPNLEASRELKDGDRAAEIHTRDPVRLVALALRPGRDGGRMHDPLRPAARKGLLEGVKRADRSEEHTSELPSLT